MGHITDATKSVEEIETVEEYDDQPDGYSHVPVIVDKSPESKLSTLEERQFLLSRDIKIVQFQFKLRKMLNLPPGQCLFLYTHNYRVWEPNTKFGELYECLDRKHINLKYTDENLYITDLHYNLKENMGNTELPKLP